jgi:hypothetical protein
VGYQYVKKCSRETLRILYNLTVDIRKNLFHIFLSSDTVPKWVIPCVWRLAANAAAGNIRVWKRNHFIDSVFCYIRVSVDNVVLNIESLQKISTSEA